VHRARARSHSADVHLCALLPRSIPVSDHFGQGIYCRDRSDRGGGANQMGRLARPKTATIDVTVPNVARMYDYLLAGRDN
jgi:hypothetical protein